MPLQPNSSVHPIRRRRPLRRAFGLSLLLAWLAALGWAALHRQDIIDWWKLRAYEPPPAIAALADQTTMTDYGRKIFYVNQPELEDKSAFAAKCLEGRGGEEQTIVLGCYRGNQGGIFLLDVNDPRLEGVEQVTAAHEMLHGAYDRLSDEERQRIDRLLTEYYKNDLNDSRIQNTVEAYQKSEPNDVVNEMHSIFSTEISNLPPELEAYYKRYFNNRKQIVGYSERYRAVFASRQDQLRQYERQLTALKAEISNREDALKSRQADIESRQSQLAEYRSEGDIAAYNAGVADYNARVDAFNAEIEAIKGLINQYNRLVALHNNLAQEQGRLVEELDANTAEPIQ